MKAKQEKGFVVITGCDSGMGKALVEELNKRGYTILQSYLETNNFEGKENIYSRKMNLRIDDDINGFCDYAKELIDSGLELKGVISNAGVALGGPIEDMPIDIFKETYDINFFGTIRIVKCFIPYLIKTKGRIIIQGSMAGKVAVPFLSPYASSKFALEGFSDSLRREMIPYGIKTTLLEAAAVATPIWNKAKKQDVSFVEDKYVKSMTEFRDKFIEGGNRGMDVKDAAKMISDIFEKNNPKGRYIIAGNRFTSKLLTFMPNFILDKVLVKMFKMDYGS